MVVVHVALYLLHPNPSLHSHFPLLSFLIKHLYDPFLHQIIHALLEIGVLDCPHLWQCTFFIVVLGFLPPQCPDLLMVGGGPLKGDYAHCASRLTRQPNGTVLTVRLASTGTAGKGYWISFFNFFISFTTLS